MTTTPRPTPAAPIPAAADVDQVLAERCQSAGDYLAGILAAGALDTAGQPAKLPELLFPHIEPWIVRQVWDAALAVGWRGGLIAARPQWAPDNLDHARATLQAAGFEAMGRLTARSASLHPPRHPADTEPPTVDGAVVRDGGHP
ncbi:hypothetical protein ACIOEZ_34130 [Streptomyces sp. NPDC087866]|uniref:hypothetical protein n=1 Tax=Streptomyces sp. NPDC087866 TaxID=3365815 RepID=UPI00380EC211